jgi:hypothetical protein
MKIRPVIIRVPVKTYEEGVHLDWLYGPDFFKEPANKETRWGSPDWDVLYAYCQRYMDFEYMYNLVEDNDGNKYGMIFVALDSDEERRLLDYLDYNQCVYGVGYLSGTKEE